MQIVSSLGWIFIIIGVVVLFVGPIPGAIFFITIGSFLVWFQLRGKRITVDTGNKLVKSGKDIIQLVEPSIVFMNEVRVSQTVNSRGSSTNVKMYFYKAYIQDGDNRALISCNRNDQRDMEAIKKIAEDLNVPFQQNYD
ncbi:MAG: hypothetical protein ABJO91_16265 [Ekhidna sp.]